MMTLPGVVTGQIIELRFAGSGKLAVIRKKIGDEVKKGETVAILDKKVLQAELDKQLADYEAIRAEWEIFNLKHPQVTDDMIKYLKVAQQARLNTAVKDVELTKFRLDEVALVSPSPGIIIDDGGNRAGLYVTPAGNAVKILDSASLALELELTFDKLPTFAQSRKARVKIAGDGREFTGSTSMPIPGDKKHFTVVIPLPEATGILPGMPGEADIDL